MAASPFAFYRGTAALMAADLAETPTSGLHVQLCGDAHLSNFGAFAAPDRRLVFDVNDFDETLAGPWEWDVKRLAASVAVAGRELGLHRKSRRRVVTASVRAYRKAMRDLATMRNLDCWYLRVEAEDVVASLRARLSRDNSERLERGVRRARRKDSLRALKRLTERVDGELRIVSDPPSVVPARDLAPGGDLNRAMDVVREVAHRYAGSLRPDVRAVVDSYDLVDVAHKVVGVGSVGTRSWVILLIGRDAGDPLFLQAKEAVASVLEPYVSRSPYRNHGRRVVEGQRLLQSASDVLLGWTRAVGVYGEDTDYHVRQLWDWKLSAEVDAMDGDALKEYAKLCAATLARGHARSGDRIEIAGYLGSGGRFEEALAEFAESYADQNQRDHEALVEAIDRGRIEAMPESEPESRR